MATRIDSDAANLMADALADEFDSVAGTLTIYSGSAPADADDAPTGTVLAAITLPTPAFGAASAGACAKIGTWEDSSANASGTAGYFRIVSNGGHVIQGTITATGMGGDMEMANTSIIEGGVVTVTSYNFTMPEAAA